MSTCTPVNRRVAMAPRSQVTAADGLVVQLGSPPSASTRIPTALAAAESCRSRGRSEEFATFHGTATNICDTPWLCAKDTTSVGLALDHTHMARLGLVVAEADPAYITLPAPMAHHAARRA